MIKNEEKFGLANNTDKSVSEISELLFKATSLGVKQ